MLSIISSKVCELICFLLSQEVLLWIESLVKECGEDITTDQLKDYVWKTLKSGKVPSSLSCCLFLHIIGVVF